MKSDVKIQNIVVSCNLFTKNCSVKKVVDNIEGVQYDPSKFPGACVRLKEPKVSILIFDSGRIVIAGLKSEEMIVKAINILKSKLRSFGVTFSKKPKWKIQNMVASSSVGFSLQLTNVVFNLENTEYNPEQFPGLVYKPTGTKLSFLLFNSGRIVCTGGKTKSEIIKAVKALIIKLKSINH